jgi:hypothetical protein
MKQKLFALLSVGIILSMANAVLAESYTYKIYNPVLNKSYIAELGTMSLTDTQYIFGFFAAKDRQPLCVANLNTNSDKNGLVGGQCTDAKAFLKFMDGENIDLNSSKYTFGYRELVPNTFYKEMYELKQERREQGKTVIGE